MKGLIPTMTALFLSGALVSCSAVDKNIQKEKSSYRNSDVSQKQCLLAVKRARNDARAGLYRLYVFGPRRYSGDFARFLLEFMKMRYGIELIIYGQDFSDRDLCYSNEMDKIIFNRFGGDILSSAETEARELFMNK